LAEANCEAERAVVASSKRRSFVMMVSVPGRFLWKVLEAGRSWKLEGLGSWKVLEAGRSWKLEGLGVC
jgi:hypothetical protein